MWLVLLNPIFGNKPDFPTDSGNKPDRQPDSGDKPDRQPDSGKTLKWVLAWMESNGFLHVKKSAKFLICRDFAECPRGHGSTSYKNLCRLSYFVGISAP